MCNLTVSERSTPLRRGTVEQFGRVAGVGAHVGGCALACLRACICACTPALGSRLRRLDRGAATRSPATDGMSRSSAGRRAQSCGPAIETAGKLPPLHAKGALQRPASVDALAGRLVLCAGPLRRYALESQRAADLVEHIFGSEAWSRWPCRNRLWKA